MKTQTRVISALFITTMASLITHSSQAEWGSYHSRTADEGTHGQTIGGGISSPSQTPSIHENPSGLILLNRPQLQASISSERGAYSRLLGTSLQFYTGNRDVGLMLGYQTFSNAGDGIGQISRIQLGLAAHSSLLNTTLAMSGSYRIAKRGTSDDLIRGRPWTTNIGLLFNSHGEVRVGTNVYGIQNGVEAVGLGLSGDINRFSTLSLDASTNDGLNGITVKPGFGIQMFGLCLSYSYGIRAIPSSVEYGISSGNTLSIGVNLTDTFKITGSYNQNSLYFLGGLFRF